MTRQTDFLAGRAIEHIERFGWWESWMLGNAQNELTEFCGMVKSATSGDHVPITLHNRITKIDGREISSVGITLSSPIGGVTASRPRRQITQLTVANYQVFRLKGNEWQDFPNKVNSGARFFGTPTISYVLIENAYTPKAVRTVRHCLENWREALAGNEFAGKAKETDLDPVETTRDGLNGQALTLFDSMKSRTHASSYKTLASLDCWRKTPPNDSAIKKALERLKSGLAKNPRQIFDVTIDHSHRRAKLERLTPA